MSISVPCFEDCADARHDQKDCKTVGPRDCLVQGKKRARAGGVHVGEEACCFV